MHVDVVGMLVLAAVRRYGDRVLADPAGPADAGVAEAGRQFARLIFGTAGADAELAALVRRPDSWRAQGALDAELAELVAADPRLEADVAAALSEFYQRQLESGDGVALAELGDLLWHADSELARTAFERAVAAGNERARISLADHLLGWSGDYDGALPLYERAVASPDPAVAAAALIVLGRALSGHGEDDAAKAAWERCVATGDPDAAPEAMVRLAAVLEREPGGLEQARALYLAAFESGHPEVAPRAMWWLGRMLAGAGDVTGAEAAYEQAAAALPASSSGHALCELADMFRDRGDIARAKDLWQRIIDGGDEDSAEMALSSLINQLEAENDLDGLRAAHQAGVGSGNPMAPYALVQIGTVLRERGDLDGWREAGQQAIDTGSEWADDLREELLPPEEDEPDDEPADLPPGLDRRNMASTGIAVLEHGLPQLPPEISHHMTIPMAYWTARDGAVVLFLNFSRYRREWEPGVVAATFTRQNGEWVADSHWHGTSFYDPRTDPGGRYPLGGEPIVVSSRLGQIICYGIAAPEVRDLALIQDGHEDRRPLASHFGAWVVHADQPGPFTVAALDPNGTILAEINPERPWLGPGNGAGHVTSR